MNVPATTAAPARHREVRLSDYRPPAYLVETVELRFDLGEEFTTVRARMELRRNPEGPGGPLELDGEDLETRELRLDGKRLPEELWKVEDGKLTIPEVPAACVLETEVRIRPQDNTRLQGLYRSGGLYCTQCEAQGFRRITWYPDRPDVMARFTTFVTAEEAGFPVLLSNGNPVEHGDLPAGRHYAKWEDPFPKPAYLFALVAGDLRALEDRFTTCGGREVTLRIFVEPGNESRCGHAMSALKQAMRWDEEEFGREYDLDLFMIVAVNDFNFGAMENKGLNIFNARYILADPETATDADYERILGVVAHEYFHNWTGDRVTLRDWFQLSLKEGLTIFRDENFSRDVTSAAIRRIEEVQTMRTSQFSQDAGPMAHPVRPESYIEINNFYTVTVYNKGAEVVGMYRTLLGGKPAFRRGMDLYFERHDGQAVTCDDFRAAMADANQVDLSQFARWYSQAGTPVLEAEGRYDAEARTYTLFLRQSCPPTPGQPEKEPFVIPISMGLLDREGRPLTLDLPGQFIPERGTELVLPMREREESFTFRDVGSEPVPSLLRGFSAPVRLRMKQSRSDLALLWAHDPDPFNRWDAGQRLGTEVLLEGVAALQASRGFELPEVFAEAFGRILAAPPEDAALFAATLALPSEAVLAEEMDPADPHALHAVREAARKALAARFHEPFLALFERCAPAGPYRFDAGSAARRRLRNTCLAWLAAPGDPEGIARCQEQYRRADNMTDKLAALALLNDHPGPERREALESFYGRWRKDPLVLDKWFTLQATSTLPGAAERVRRMLEHPDYDPRNPNRVRALLGAFGTGNPVGFHETDGAGHALLAEQVLATDRINPQVAARLAAPFTRWRKYVEPLAGSLRGRLEDMLAAGGLSRDLYEIVSKSLDN